jgi:signal-transduction protein with cAMP-binding, CBS, and nucleotidyltransferase domain
LGLDFGRALIVREAMSSPVVTVWENDSAADAAGVMKEHGIGAIIVNGEESQPVGIVTERDLVYRVIAEKRSPSEIKVKEVMSSPLMTVDPETSLDEAMAMMSMNNIRRLGVVYKGSLEGVISDKDIIRIMPSVIEIVRERSKIQSGDRPSGPSIVGYCDRCEMYTSDMRNVDGEFICEDCRAG